MKNFMRRANSVLLGIVVFLGLALTGVTLSNVQAQTGGTLDPPGWNPNTPVWSNCEVFIDMTYTCPELTTTKWSDEDTICKTNYVGEGRWCC